MKAILVIDEMPTICYKCPCYDHEGGWCQATCNWKTERDNGCPLKLMPEKKDEHVKLNNWELENIINAENRGYNRFIDEILGGKNDKKRTI